MKPDMGFFASFHTREENTQLGLGLGGKGLLVRQKHKLNQDLMVRAYR